MPFPQHFVLPVQGVKEVTLLGQNVNSYRDTSQTTIPLSYGASTDLSEGFRTIYKTKEGGRRFVDLLDRASLVSMCMHACHWVVTVAQRCVLNRLIY